MRPSQGAFIFATLFTMKQKTFFLIIFSFLLGLCTFYFLEHIKQSHEEAQRMDTLTFSNTQTWDTYFLDSAQSATNTEIFKLLPPPKNSSKITKKDLAALHNYQQERTEENIAEIQREIFLDDAFFGTETFASLTDVVRRPNTSALMQFVIDYELPIILEQKLRYNRVRPSYLDPTLTPAIEVPPHPAYPSGHATQARLRALIFSELNPQNQETYQKAANRIAHNREIAGVHYPSDTRAGVIMAEQIFNALLENDDFLMLLEDAKTEW
jgi:acid phosphatase (class A)